jgi:hypothetical protein
MLLTLYKFKYLFSKGNDKNVNVETDQWVNFTFLILLNPRPIVKTGILPKIQYIKCRACGNRI